MKFKSLPKPVSLHRPLAVGTTAIALFFCIVVYAAEPLTAQGTRADYERVESLSGRMRNKVFRLKVEPHWFAGGDQFWYRIEVAERRYHFIWVDAIKGQRREAFDHARLAAALGEHLGKEFTADRLPFDQIEFESDLTHIRFSAGGKKWRFDRAKHVLSEATRAAPSSNGSTVDVLPSPRIGNRRGAETEIVFRNKTKGTVKLYWIDDLRDPTLYEEIAAGAEHAQHTYGGHTWLVRNQQGKTIGAYAATDDPSLAVIDGTWTQSDPPTPNRDRNDSRRQQFRGNRSPDGKWEARIVDHNVILRDRASDEEFPLSGSGTSGDPFTGRFDWSPDSSRLVVTQEAPGELREVHMIESSPRDQVQPKLHTHRYTKPGDRIARPRPRLFDVANKKQIEIDDDLFSNPWSMREIRWADDSSRFTFEFNQRGHQALRLIAVDAENGSVRAIIDERSKTFIDYSSKYFLEYLNDTNELIWMSERDGWNHLYLIDSQTGEVKNQITRGEWVVRDIERIDRDSRQIWFRAGGIHADQDPYHVHYCRINFDGSGLTMLTEGDGTHRIEYSPDGRYLIDSYSRVDLAPVTELRRADDGKLVCKLEEADWTELLEAGWQTPERFTAKGRDGETDISGIIHRPTNFDPQQKYPVIEAIYAGPHSAHVPKRFTSLHGAQRMAELGFIVVQIDGMGTSHRSKAFHDVCWQNLGDAGFPDRVAWIKAAASERPWMDIERVGIYGGSAGGQNAMRALISHGDFYDVAVADCGCHDNRMDKIWWNEQWMGYPIGEHYKESSNVEQAHRMQGKLLLIVGELDRNVDPASTMQVVDALIRADKDFDLLIIPGAGHGAAGSRYGTRRQRDFFVRHLLGVEPRAN